MPPPQKKQSTEKKRRNKRKSRTEVSSDSSSSAESSSSEDERTKPAQKPSQLPKTSSSPPPQVKASPAPQDTDHTFAEFYLRQATKEFANDLDTLRSAGDFHAEKSVKILIGALRQGVGMFGAEERRGVVEGMSGKSVIGEV